MSGAPVTLNLKVSVMHWPRLVSIEDVEDGCVEWGDPDVIAIYAKDGRRLTWADLNREDYQ